jgi:UDP-glucuronate 4-epimerase
MKILITGAAGFIGFSLAKRLLDNNVFSSVVGIDNMNDYYTVKLKEDRLKILLDYEKFSFKKFSLEDRENILSIFKHCQFDIVVNLAAQAGVRYSLQNPFSYIDSNINGFINILEGCRHNGVKHLVFASSSSVYGANRKMPFSVHHNVDHPVSLYAATKKANELMAHCYSHLYNLPCTGLRFFTVYGPWGRPDMALFKFTKNIISGIPIDVYNFGKMKRDFTYIDDIVEGISRVIYKIPEKNSKWNPLSPDPSSSYAPYKIYNIGNNQPVELLDFVYTIEDALGIKAKINFLEMQPGDVPETYADVDDLTKDVGFKPSTPLKTGVSKFIKWYKNYYKIGG